MKKQIIALALLAGSFVAAGAQVYLDPKAPIEERVKDALSIMTTHEKVRIIH